MGVMYCQENGCLIYYRVEFAKLMALTKEYAKNFTNNPKCFEDWEIKKATAINNTLFLEIDKNDNSTKLLLNIEFINRKPNKRYNYINVQIEDILKEY